MNRFAVVAACLIFCVTITGKTMAEEGGNGSADVTLPSLVMSATGYEIPANRVSSDITVITEEEISHLPARDVSEALNYVTGVDIQRAGGAGNSAAVSIQGSDYRHVKILIDGMPVENISESFPDLSILPLENVKRIEVMKGAASSVWGSSLGGVINIITKEPADELTVDGGISFGENSTNNYRAGLSGHVGNSGYFLSLSRFETDGFHDFQEADNNYLYTKWTNEMTSTLKGTVTYAFSDINREDSGWQWEEDSFEQRISLALDYKPVDKLEYSLSAYARQFNGRFEIPDMGIMRDVENIYGGTFSTLWRHSDKGNFFVGFEGSHGDLELDLTGGWEDYEVDKTAVFANEALTLGRLSLNAGVRYDNDSVFGSETSPSAGFAYDLGHSTIVRLNAARGFTPPPVTYRYYGSDPNNGLNAEQAWTYQAGIESGVIPMLWGKVTFYRADVTDAIDFVYNSDDTLNKIDNISRVRRQGVEADLKTGEFKGLTLSAGYAFNDVRNLDTDEIVTGQARIIYNAGINYKGPFDTMATLNGHWVWWHADPGFGAKDKTWVWDAKLSKYLAKWKFGVGELFLSVHNITDEEQYWAEFYKNPGRWVEAGITLTTF